MRRRVSLWDTGRGRLAHQLGELSGQSRGFAHKMPFEPEIGLQFRSQACPAEIDYV